jgi:UDP-N-acetylglucosamine--N-acetylmuramyl-(pentapeptide) pyrophosphoryl-undecaprenol N-acetylglucosamine transferase
VPYPYAWRYQHQNAEYLAKSGGAVLLEDKQLAQELTQQVSAILNDPQKLKEMQTAMRQLAVPDSAARIADLVLSTGKGAKGGNTWSA